MRASGILLPVSSLPSKYGIGCFSKEAYEFVDMVACAGQKYWQILPLGPTSYGDSPYQSFSTFAGNPYFIDLDTLVEEGLILREECESCDWGESPEVVDYGQIYQMRYPLLRKAYNRSGCSENPEFIRFVEENKSWLDDYSLFMALKDQFGGACWDEWEEDIRLRNPIVMELCREKLRSEIGFQQYIQFLFEVQWKKLKEYANQKGIEIIGDIPIYVAFDSADTWANPELFQFNAQNHPEAIAGCPPDAFSDIGQVWGNPLYRWEYHKKTNYRWWAERIQYCKKRYDVIRIDHFRGFDEYYSIPYGEKTAKNGHWEKGPGVAFFESIKKQVPDLNIILEDLGYNTESVKQLVKDCGYPGMKILEFGFDSREPGNYIPYTYERNNVVYTGTHDNETLAGWYGSMAKSDREWLLEYLGKTELTTEQLCWEMIRMAFQSVCNLCVVPVQDYLCLGNEARINKPATVQGNWSWRMKDGAMTEALIAKIKRLTEVYGR